MAGNTQRTQKAATRIKIPKEYKVVMYNDDFTPMDFVVQILVEIFKKSYQEAFQLMMNVHQGEKAVVGVYSYDIAKTKAGQAVKAAREQGYPFRVEVEE